MLALASALGWGGCGDGSLQTPDAAEEGAPALKLRVRTARVESGRLGEGLRLSGTVRAFVEAEVKAETQGRVIARSVERGDRVSQGDVLLELDASRLELQLRQAEASLGARRTDLVHARREFERGETLAERDALSQQQRDDLRHRLQAARDGLALAEVARDTARRMLEDASIRAPFDGRVDDLFVEIGDYVAPGTAVARVLDLSDARIFGGVTAEEAAGLEPGMRADAHFPSLGGFSQPAVLRSVARAADPSDGTYRIELWIEEPDARLRDGVVASLEFSDSGRSILPLAPRAALLRRAGRSEVFVVERNGAGEGAGVARLRPVRTGRSGTELVEILEGLAQGDEVVIEGQFALRDRAVVSVDGTQRLRVDAEAQSAEVSSAP